MTALLARADHWRAGVLRWSLQLEPLRLVFLSRPLRLGFTFGLSLIVNLYLACAAPMLLLVLGPLVMGVPHLFAGVRYLPEIVAGEPLSGPIHKRLSLVLAIALFGVAFVRIGVSYFHISLPALGLVDGWEWLALGLTALAFFPLAKRHWQITWRFFILAPLLIGSWFYPFATAGLLILVHNFVPFIFWFKLGRSRADRRVSLLAAGAFVAMSTLILTGELDFLARALSLPFHFFKSVDPYMIANQIFPTAQSTRWLERGLMAYAFGQSLHYFVWLKAIPEQSLRQQVPLSFVQSGKLWLEALGKPLMAMALILSCLLPASALFFDVGLLRNLYLAGVTAHGYLELAALPFLMNRFYDQ
jgi:hypothetical protein